ncbi:hypothetical protein BJX63DRAFT_351482 [Aspergillus granulosus]|uniref:Uncharacterized protein n=1 Tax=Aspergillus granulosus TaxID=176169 RepID=A0ABR4H441_9EURO
MFSQRTLIVVVAFLVLKIESTVVLKIGHPRRISASETLEYPKQHAAPSQTPELCPILQSYRAAVSCVEREYLEAVQNFHSDPNGASFANVALPATSPGSLPSNGGTLSSVSNDEMYVDLGVAGQVNFSLFKLSPLLAVCFSFGGRLGPAATVYCKLLQ